MALRRRFDTDYGRLARSAAPTGAGCRHRSDRAGLVGARVAQGPYDVARRASCARRQQIARTNCWSAAASILPAQRSISIAQNFSSGDPLAPGRRGLAGAFRGPGNGVDADHLAGDIGPPPQIRGLIGSAPSGLVERRWQCSLFHTLRTQLGPRLRSERAQKQKVL
jgi:hypothetical protein